MKSRNHPVWEIIRVAVFGVIGLIALAIFASEFDSTEWSAIGSWVAVGGGANWVISRMIQVQEPQTEEKDDEPEK